MLVLGAAFPDQLPQLIAYQLLIVKHSIKFEYPSWLWYDIDFRQWAASNGYHTCLKFTLNSMRLLLPHKARQLTGALSATPMVVTILTTVQDSHPRLVHSAHRSRSGPPSTLRHPLGHKNLIQSLGRLHRNDPALTTAFCTIKITATAHMGIAA